VDWVESFHDVALGRPGEGVIEQFRIEPGPAGVQRLIARYLELEPDPTEGRVVLETRHGLLTARKTNRLNPRHEVDRGCLTTEPSARSVSAALAPANPAPTMRKVCRVFSAVVMSCSVLSAWLSHGVAADGGIC
jgi:hypothetical protein